MLDAKKVAPGLQYKYKAKHYPFSVLYQPHSLPTAHLGIILSKRYIKRAVDRNKLKRLIRECFRAHRIAQQPLECLILITAPFTPLDNQTWRETINQLLNNVKEC